MALYCMDFFCIFWYHIVFMLHRLVLHGIVLYLTLLHGIALLEIDANNSFPSCAQLSDGRVLSCGHQPHPPRPNMKLLCKTFQYAFKYDTSWCSGRICAPCLNSRSGINLPPPILAGHNSFCPLWKIFAGLPPIIEKGKSSRSVRICSILLMNSDMWKVRNVIELLCHVIWADKSKLLLLSLLPMTMK